MMIGLLVEARQGHCSQTLSQSNAKWLCAVLFQEKGHNRECVSASLSATMASIRHTYDAKTTTTKENGDVGYAMREIETTTPTVLQTTPFWGRARRGPGESQI